MMEENPYDFAEGLLSVRHLGVVIYMRRWEAQLYLAFAMVVKKRAGAIAASDGQTLPFLALAA